MVRSLLSVLLVLPLIAVAGCSSDNALITPVNLRCEYRVNPLGIDNPEPRLSWTFASDARNQVQRAWQIIVSGSPEQLARDNGDVWDSGRIDSSMNINVPYQGAALVTGTRYHWKVRVWDGDGRASEWSEPAWFEAALMSPDDWEADWIGDGRPAPERAEDFYDFIPNTLLRRDFVLDKPIARARLYISGLGYYEAYLNGRLVGDSVLDPAWTSYENRVYYATYDVTSMLRDGPNAIGVMLGNGWYNPLPLGLFRRVNLRNVLEIGQPKLLARIYVEYTDGTTERIRTNNTWSAGEGPVLKNNVYLGEYYDARREQPGWSQPGFDVSTWRQAVVAPAPPGTLMASDIPPIRITKTLKPVAITQPQPGVYIFDMGQNYAGWIRLRANGPAGTVIRLRYAEILTDDGLPDFRTSAAGQIKEGGISGGPGAPPTAWQEDNYVLKGGGPEEYTQHFTFHGFRFIEVTGYPGVPTLDDMDGLRLNADVEQAGMFACSNPMFNQLQDVIDWTFKSNIFSIESDCPQREKFGYGGDMVAAGESFMYNYNMANFYEKTVRDFADDQLANGGMTECAPDNGIASSGLGGGSGPVGWQLAHPFLQDRLYRFYGDQRLIEEQYEPTRRLVAFLRTVSPGYRITRGISDHASIDPKPTALTSTAFYYHIAALAAEFAGILGHTEDERAYSALADSIKQVFIDDQLEEGTGRFGDATEACQTFALYYDLVPPEERDMALDRLVAAIMDDNDGHVTSGIFGTKMVFNVLADNGRGDVAYTMTNQRDYPGWGNMLANDATTLWEEWDGNKGASYNHPMFGSPTEWFFRGVAGINPGPDAAGFDQIVIRPEPAGTLTWAKGQYESVRGLISSSWEIADGAITLNVTVPVNTTAEVHVPAARAEDATEGGVPAADVPGIEFLRMEHGAAVFGVGSGTYTFTAPHE